MRPQWFCAGALRARRAFRASLSRPGRPARACRAAAAIVRRRRPGRTGRRGCRRSSSGGCRYAAPAPALPSDRRRFATGGSNSYGGVSGSRQPGRPHCGRGCRQRPGRGAASRRREPASLRARAVDRRACRSGSRAGPGPRRAAEVARPPADSSCSRPAPWRWAVRRPGQNSAAPGLPSRMRGSRSWRPQGRASSGRGRAGPRRSAGLRRPRRRRPLPHRPAHARRPSSPWRPPSAWTARRSRGRLLPARTRPAAVPGSSRPNRHRSARGDGHARAADRRTVVVVAMGAGRDAPPGTDWPAGCRYVQSGPHGSACVPFAQ
jgi:hypothetical protein